MVGTHLPEYPITFIGVITQALMIHFSGLNGDVIILLESGKHRHAFYNKT